MTGPLIILPDFVEGKISNFSEFRAKQKGSFLYSSYEDFYLVMNKTIFGSQPNYNETYINEALENIVAENAGVFHIENSVIGVKS